MKMFRQKVNISMINIGFSPFIMNLNGTLETITQAANTTAHTPKPIKLFTMNSSTIYKTVAIIFVRGSRSWITDLPG